MSFDERLKYVEMKARHKDLLLPWYKKWWGAIIIIISGLFLIFLTICSFYVINKIKEIRSGQSPTATEEQRQEYLKNIQGDGTNYYLGTNNPQVTIVEFGDFACPYCHKSATTTRKIAAKYADKVKFVWRDYLRNQDSIDLAMSARCAGEQGKFWEMHDELFSHQDKFSTSTEERRTELMALAQNLKLDTAKFSTCLTSRQYLDRIKKDYDDGNKLEIVGTPTWYINNYPMAGIITEEKFDELINGLLK